MRKYILYIFLALSASLMADNIYSSAELSIYTCQPGNRTYSKYGHTAVHLVDTANMLDCVFNYGVFDFNMPNFVPNFIQGKAYYLLDVEPTDFFIESCHEVGRYNIYEQHLNLTDQQKEDILVALSINLMPENMFYKYNFVFDNCATRPYRLLIRSLHEKPEATAFSQRQDSYREMITYYSGKYTWSCYGINLMFGRDADRIMQHDERLFLPEQLMDYLSEATLSDGTKLVDYEQVGQFVPDKGLWIISPQACGTLLIILCLLLCYADIKRKRVSWWFDFALMLVMGLFGCVVCYLSMFSQQPLVGHNINLIFLNPLWLIASICLCFKRIRQWLFTSRIAQICITALFAVSFLIMALYGQHHLFVIAPSALLLHIMLTWSNTPCVETHVNASPKKKHTPKTVITTLTLFFLYSHTATAQQPKLTVIAMVDGMSSSAMNEMREYWAKGGLRTMTEEAYQTTLSFPHFVYGGAETVATLMTGTTPDKHGIMSDNYFKRSDRNIHSILEDKEYKGIGTKQTLSCRNLKAVSLTDEMRIRYGQKAKIYAIGQQQNTVMLLAGHAANACCWIDGKTKKWVSTTYFDGGLPSAADQMNVQKRIEEVASRVWTPKMSTGAYLHATPQEQKKGFSYSQSEWLTQSPGGNQLVTELALDLQKKERLGSDNTPDMLLLEYNVISPHAESEMLLTAEQEDMYITLNIELGYLMEQLDSRIGHDSYRLVVVGNPQIGNGAAIYQQANIETTTFNVNRAAALINTYLMAMYGHERWIDGAYGQYIYLNRTLIEQKQMSLSDMQRQVANFLLEFDGVENAMPTYEVALLPNEGDNEKIRRSCNRRLAGDVVFTLQYNCRLMYDDTTIISRVLDSNPTVPLYIWSSTRSPHPNGTPNATSLKSLLF